MEVFLNLGLEQVTQTQHSKCEFSHHMVYSGCEKKKAQLRNIVYIHVPVVILILLMELFDWSVWKMALGRGLEVASRKATGETDNTRQSNSQSNSKRRKQNVKSETVKRPTIRCRALLCQTRKKKQILHSFKTFLFIPKKNSRFGRFYIHSIILIHFKEKQLFQNASLCCCISIWNICLLDRPSIVSPPCIARYRSILR